jgi:hypothetical protein
VDSLYQRERKVATFESKIVSGDKEIVVSSHNCGHHMVSIDLSVYDKNKEFIGGSRDLYIDDSAYESYVPAKNVAELYANATKKHIQDSEDLSNEEKIRLWDMFREEHASKIVCLLVYMFSYMELEPEQEPTKELA